MCVFVFVLMALHVRVSLWNMLNMPIINMTMVAEMRITVEFNNLSKADLATTAK